MHFVLCFSVLCLAKVKQPRSVLRTQSIVLRILFYCDEWTSALWKFLSIPYFSYLLKSIISSWDAPCSHCIWVSSCKRSVFILYLICLLIHSSLCRFIINRLLHVETFETYPWKIVWTVSIWLMQSEHGEVTTARNFIFIKLHISLWIQHPFS